jgi:hypothetical protein
MAVSGIGRNILANHPPGGKNKWGFNAVRCRNRLSSGVSLD